MTDERVGVLDQERRRQAAMTDDELAAEHYDAAVIIAAAKGQPAPDRATHRAAWEEARA